MTAQPTRSRAGPLISHLHDLAGREDRGALAALRRGLGKQSGITPEMYPHVEPYLQGASMQETEAAYLVASLFGSHPVVWHSSGDRPRNTSLGWTLQQIRFRESSPKEEDQGAARRFLAILSCDQPELGTHLRHLISLLHSRHPAAQIDWERLYRDIRDWDDIDRKVQRRWAEDFWRGNRQVDAGADPESNGSVEEHADTDK